ncbi:hypothetical protein GQR58_007533 [Nymphon striatum]|nr:hypothetical protein GQR58_007533 [Nymphon striatum]
MCKSFVGWTLACSFEGSFRIAGDHPECCSCYLGLEGLCMSIKSPIFNNSTTRIGFPRPFFLFYYYYSNTYNSSQPPPLRSTGPAKTENPVTNGVKLKRFSGRNQVIVLYFDRKSLPSQSQSSSISLLSEFKLIWEIWLKIWIMVLVLKNFAIFMHSFISPVHVFAAPRQPSFTNLLGGWSQGRRNLLHWIFYAFTQVMHKTASMTIMSKAGPAGRPMALLGEANLNDLLNPNTYLNLPVWPTSFTTIYQILLAYLHSKTEQPHIYDIVFTGQEEILSGCLI